MINPSLMDVRTPSRFNKAALDSTGKAQLKSVLESRRHAREHGGGAAGGDSEGIP